MTGKTIERVEYGQRQDCANAHTNELIHIHFTDGSIVSFSTGSNALRTLKPHDFHVNFFVESVPPYWHRENARLHVSGKHG